MLTKKIVQRENHILNERVIFKNILFLAMVVAPRASD